MNTTKKSITTTRSEIVIKKTAAFRFLTLIISLILGGALICFMKMTFWLADPIALFQGSSFLSFAFYDLFILTVNTLIIFCAFGMLYSVIGRPNRIVLGIGSLLMSFVSAYILHNHALMRSPIEVEEFGADRALFIFAAEHVIYGILLFLASWLIGSLLLKKLKKFEAPNA